MKTLLSNCCNANVSVVGDETTHFACDKCGEACDVNSKKKNVSSNVNKTESWEDRFEEELKGLCILEEEVEQLKRIVSQELLHAKQEEQKRFKEGDLVSNCCAADFDPLGVEKEPGIWQEKCLKCGKLCEPLYLSANDIKNIQRLGTL